jgi:hypothetical protein
MRIEPWNNRRYFAVSPGEGCRKLLYTPRSYLRQHWAEEDNSRVLVAFIPSGAKVRMTTAEEVSDGAMATAEEWEEVDMRRDMLLMVHDNASHPSLELTAQALKAMVYWPHMVEGSEGVRRHLKACVCANDGGGVRNVGAGMDTKERMAVLQMDHMVLSKKRAEMAGCSSVLVMVDVATRFTMYVPVQTQTAMETGRVIICKWMPVFGLPLLILTDSHGGFRSEVMQFIYSVVGIQWNEAAAGGAKGMTAIAESSINEVQQVVADGFAKGDINSLEEFELYLAFAMVKKNQIRELGRSTAFEMMMGQQARTGRMLALGTPTDLRCEGMEEGMKGDVRSFVTGLQGYTKALVEYEFSIREEKARANLMRRDKSDRQTNAVDYRIAQGDKVSFAGKHYEVLELHGEKGWPVTATIGSTPEDVHRFRVRYELLKIPGAAMPTKMLPRMKELLEGAFVMWKETKEVYGGVIQAVGQEGGMHRVHLYEGNESGASWLPLWVCDDDPAIITRGKKGAEGSSALVQEVLTGRILMDGEISDTFRLVKDTMLRAKALNLM